MPDVDLGALTIPAFAAIFSAGWTSYHVFIGRELRSRVERMETRMDEIEKEDREELATLRQKLYQR